MVEEHQPDVIVTDYTLATSIGTNLLHEARVTSPKSRCVVLSEKSDEGERDAAFAAGARAYCAKLAEPDDLAAAIRQLLSPSIYFADSQPRSSHSERTYNKAKLLTKREAEILRLTAEGHSNSRAREDALGDRADGEVPPVEHLPQARRDEPAGGEPVGACKRSH